MLDQQALFEESKAFLEKYEKVLPDTIYYKNWKIRKPNVKVIHSIKSTFLGMDKSSLCFGEIGIGMGATTYHLAKFLGNEGNLHIFDFLESVVPVAKMLSMEGYTNVHIHGASYKKMDSYNWNLLSLLQKHNEPMFDYVFLDGAHSFPVDGLAFFLIDLLLKEGGYIEFDDYHWTHADHITRASKKYTTDLKSEYFGSFMERTLESFTLPQLKMKQVAAVVDTLVARTGRYKQIIPHRVFQKIT